MGSWTSVLTSLANLALVVFVFQMMMTTNFFAADCSRREIVKIDTKLDGYDLILINVRGISDSGFYDDSKSFLNFLLM